MAKIKFGSFVTDMRGKIGGSIYSKNGSGSYVKNLTVPINPNTSRQQAVRNDLKQLSQLWRTASDEERKAWNMAALNQPRQDDLGNTYTQSGFNMFVGVNMIGKALGGAVKANPPQPTPPPDLGDIELVYDAVTPAINMTESGAAVPADTSWIIYMTAPISTGNNSWTSLLSQVIVLPAGTGVSPYNLYAAYVAKFGAPVIGQKSGFKCVPVHNTSYVQGGAVYKEVWF